MLIRTIQVRLIQLVVTKVGNIRFLINISPCKGQKIYINENIEFLRVQKYLSDPYTSTMILR